MKKIEKFEISPDNTKVQLITYPDSLGGDLKALKMIMDEYLFDITPGLHILPFYPYSSDRGFSPLTHRQVDKRFGSIGDIQNIGNKYLLMSDLIVNHVSLQSKYFQNYIKCGTRSKYRNFFVDARDFARHLRKPSRSILVRSFWNIFDQTMVIVRNLDFIFHKHGVSRLILKKIYRPRPGSPFVKFIRGDGKIRYLCCTFSPDQIDLNIKSSGVRKKFKRDIKFLADHGVRYLRLDAVGYAGKRRGTNNFLIPETINFIKWLSRIAHRYGMKVIPEIHYHYKTQISLAHLPLVDYVYDFALPFLTLHALYSGNGEYLKNWIKKRPNNSISNLDTHDGIGVVDVEDLLPKKEVEKTSQQVYLQGGNAAKRASGKNSENVDVYQINCTYFSALGGNEDAYIVARAIQLFLPGIPQIYYVGLLAGKNDEKLLEKTKNGRDVNRHFYSLNEIKKEIKRPVVKRLFELCRLRNEHPAFKGDFEIRNTENHIIELLWRYKTKKLLLRADLKEYKIEITENKNKKII